MERVIAELRACCEDVPVPLDLPEFTIQRYQYLLFGINNIVHIRQFMLTVSDVIYGTMEPVTVADPNSHTYLPEVAAVAWSLGVSRELIPLCEYRGSYYCTNEIGEVVFWENGAVTDEDPWADVWVWAEHVWLNS